MAVSMIPDRRNGAMKSLLERYGLLAALVAMIAFFAIKEPNFVNPTNVTSMLRTVAVMFIMVCGLTWIVATGKIDVSFYAVAALSNVVVASLVQGGWDWTTAYAVAVVIAVVVGFVNGYLISYLDLPDLVVTICSASFLVSLALVLSSGSSFGIDRPGWLFEFMHATVGDFVGREGTETAGGIGPVPLVLLVAVLVLAVTWFTQERLTFGHYIYAQAGNYEAVHEAGVKVRQLNLLLFIFSAIMAATAGVLVAAEFRTGQPNIGASYFIDGLTAVFLGSLFLRAGQANVIGTFVGVVFLVVIGRGAAVMGWLSNEGIGEMIKASILLLGTGLAIFAQSRSRDASHEV